MTLLRPDSQTLRYNLQQEEKITVKSSCSANCLSSSGFYHNGFKSPQARRQLRRVVSSQPNLYRMNLTYAYKLCILMHMRTTLNIDEMLIEKASRLTGITEKTSLVRMGLEALIARESGKRLAELGGTEKSLNAVPRRRTRPRK